MPMDAVLDQAHSDAEAILACLSSLSLFVIHADRLARSFAMLKAHGDKIGADAVADNARVLKIARERLDILVQDFGDHFNNGDACTATMAQQTAPMYALLKARKNGVSTDD